MISRRKALQAAGATISAAALAGQAWAQPDPFALAAIRGHLELLDAQADLRSGGPGERALAARVRAALGGAGFALHAETLQCPYFETRTAALRWEGGGVPVHAQAPVRTTGPNGLAAPLRLWRDAQDTPGMGGAIALAMLPHARHSQLLAQPVRGVLEQLAQAGPLAIGTIM